MTVDLDSLSVSSSGWWPDGRDKEPDAIAVGSSGWWHETSLVETARELADFRMPRDATIDVRQTFQRLREVLFAIVGVLEDSSSPGGSQRVEVSVVEKLHDDEYGEITDHLGLPILTGVWFTVLDSDEESVLDSDGFPVLSIIETTEDESLRDESGYFVLDSGGARIVLEAA